MQTSHICEFRRTLLCIALTFMTLALSKIRSVTSRLNYSSAKKRAGLEHCVMSCLLWSYFWSWSLTPILDNFMLDAWRCSTLLLAPGRERYQKPRGVSTMSVHLLWNWNLTVFPLIILHSEAQDHRLETVRAQSEPHALWWNINLSLLDTQPKLTYISSIALSRS